VATAVCPALKQAHPVARRIPVGVEAVDAPASAQDPGTQALVQRLTAKLREQGGADDGADGPTLARTAGTDSTRLRTPV
jgi:hypothetical protein